RRRRQGSLKEVLPGAGGEAIRRDTGGIVSNTQVVKTKAVSLHEFRTSITPPLQTPVLPRRAAAGRPAGRRRDRRPPAGPGGEGRIRPRAAAPGSARPRSRQRPRGSRRHAPGSPPPLASARRWRPGPLFAIRPGKVAAPLGCVGRPRRGSPGPFDDRP